MGKSTSAQLLGRDHGYVYYEADCFKKISNPYVPLSVDNPSLAHVNQKVLRGPGAEERKAMIERTSSLWSDMMTGEFSTELMLEFYEHLALDIRREKKRIGGDFAIAMFILKKEAREHIRKILGSDLIIVNLSMSKEDRRERVLIRHPGDHATADRMDVSNKYPAPLFQTELLMEIIQFFANLMDELEESEPNTVEVNISRNMSKTEVVEEILWQVSQVERRT